MTFDTREPLRRARTVTRAGYAWPRSVLSYIYIYVIYFRFCARVDVALSRYMLI